MGEEKPACPVLISMEVDAVCSGLVSWQSLKCLGEELGNEMKCFLRGGHRGREEPGCELSAALIALS